MIKIDLLDDQGKVTDTVETQEIPNGFCEQQGTDDVVCAGPVYHFATAGLEFYACRAHIDEDEYAQFHAEQG